MESVMILLLAPLVAMVVPDKARLATRKPVGCHMIYIQSSPQPIFTRAVDEMTASSPLKQAAAGPMHDLHNHITRNQFARIVTLVILRSVEASVRAKTRVDTMVLIA